MSASKKLIQASAGNVAGGDFYPYAVDNSARFNDNDSAYLYRTPSTAGNRKTWTWSGWVKRGNLDTYQSIVPYTESGAEWFGLFWDANNSLVYDVCWTTFTNRIIKQTPALFRDTSSWYHITLVVDTTQAVGDDRIKLYVNGSQVLFTTYVTGSGSVPQNQNLYTNTTTVHYIGRRVSSNRYLDGYLSEVNFIDGQALDPTSFGENKNGVWIPKEYSGSFGTNGYYLDFANSGALGTDVSGNGNNFTSSGLTSSDQMTDTPTNNFPTYTPSETHVYQTISDGNLQSNAVAVAYSAPNYANYNPLYASMRLPSTGKWYWEGYCVLSGAVSGYLFGIADSTEFKKSVLPSYTPPTFRTYWSTGNSGYYGYRSSNSSFSNNNSNYPVAHMSIAIDMDTGKMWVGANGSWIGGGNPATGTSPGLSDLLTGDGEGVEWCPYFGSYVWSGLATGATSVMNFGQGGANALGNSDENGLGNFRYAPPSGYLALCTANLPEPTIGPNSDTTSDENFNTVLWTGTSLARSITGVGFQPDFLWTKSRSTAESHRLHDAVRGGNGSVLYELNSNETSAEGTDTLVSSLDADGFSIAAGGNSPNVSGRTYVGWNWKANGAGVTNNDGAVTSTVSVNQDAGFSIITYPYGQGTAGHGLGAIPDFFILKERSPNANSWYVWHKDLSGTDYFLYLNNTGAESNPYGDIFYLTSTTFGANSGLVGRTGVAYAFLETESFSSFGSYAGNGSNDGPFVYTGFRPAFVIMKRIDNTGAWHVFDNKRSGYNYANDVLQADADVAELSGQTYQFADLLSNGFKVRRATYGPNVSGGTYIYMAFAENPFKYANAR